MVAPNRMIANGNQAIGGIVCIAVISEPTAARSGLIRDTSAPTTAPMTRASANPMTARRMVVSIACHSTAVLHLVPQVGQGRGRPGQDRTYFHPLR